jgi:hypothetical protein
MVASSLPSKGPVSFNSPFKPCLSYTTSIMRTSLVAPLLAFISLNLNVHVQAWPAMAQQVAEISRRAPQAVAPDVPFDGDIQRVGLGDVKNGGTTPVGTSVYNILMGTEAGDSAVAGYKPPGLIGTKACKADTCCVWWYISQAMTLAFTGPTGRCNGFARAAIRLGFHDAGSWSSSLAAAGQDFGGADGSIILSGTEINRAGRYSHVFDAFLTLRLTFL